MAVFRKTSGGSGGSDTYLEYPLSPAATHFVVQHNLGKKPSVTIVDSAGTEMECDVQYLDLNRLTIDSSALFSGSAILN